MTTVPTHRSYSIPILLWMALTLLLPPASSEAQITPDVIQALQYRPIGPAVMGGRVSDIAVDHSNTSTFYVGTATGGLWKTTNHGASFEPLFDDQAVSSIGDVTLSQGNPNLVWVGTGEPQNRQSSPWGNGVYKSLDGGRTWQHMGLEETHTISRIRIAPQPQAGTVFVAAVGHLWGPNEERGVYRSLNGGNSWEKVLYVDEFTGAIDLAMDPQDPRTLYAAMYQRQRTGYGFNGGGPGSGIYRTMDNGTSWEKLTDGLPETEMGRIGLDVFAGDGSIVYAIVEAVEGRGVYRSDDRGDTWVKQSDTNPRPMYYSQIRVDPNDAEQVYLGGTQFYRSSDGGKNFEVMGWQGVHVDHHAIWIDPNDGDHLLLGNDGGIYASFDRADSWRMYDNVALGQFYEIGVDMQDPYWVCGGLQDNGSWCGPSQTYSTNGILNTHWVEINGADGFYTPMDPSDPNIVYAEAQTGRPVRIDLRTGERKSIRPLGRPDEGGEDLPSFRWNWNSPFEISHHDPAVLYYGSNVLFRSPDRGQSWEQISDDLTKGFDRDTLQIMGVELSAIRLSRNDGISFYGDLTQIAESPLNPEVLYAGTDDGNLQVTRDRGATWTNVVDRIRGLPSRTYVSGIFASAHAEGRVYATFDGHRNDDYAAYAFVSEDYGETWTRIANGLPETSVNRIIEHPRTADLLFLANEVGVFFSLNRGQEWVQLKNNLPTVPVDEVLIHPRENDLVVGTHGRSIWILDDVTPLEKLTEATNAERAYLFPVKPGRMMNLASPESFNAGMFSAPNPERGARIRYLLAQHGQPDHAHGEMHPPEEGAEDHTQDLDHFTARITILDGNGNVVRTVQEPGSGSKGMHEWSWNLRMDLPIEMEGDGGFRGPRGPFVRPGSYTVRLEAGGETLTTPVVVEPDPRLEGVAEADFIARREAIEALFGLLKPAYEARQVMTDIQEEMELLAGVLEARDEVSEETQEAFDNARRELSTINREAGQAFSQTTRLMSSIESCHCRPTEDEMFQVERAPSTVEDAVAHVNQAASVTMPDLYRALGATGVLQKTFPTVDLPGGR